MDTGAVIDAKNEKALGDNQEETSVVQPLNRKFNSDADENENETKCKRIRSSPPLPPITDDVDNNTVLNNIHARETQVAEKLDVPSKELLCIRKQVLIEKLMSSPSKSASDDVQEEMEVQAESIESQTTTNKGSRPRSRRPSRGQPQKHPPQPEVRKTFKLQSTLLDRVKSFLPEMKSANEQLLRLPDPSKLSLESESDRDEMDGAGPSSVAQPSTSAPKTKAYVEMNLALVEQSDSETSSDDETPIFSKSVLRLPDNIGKNKNGKAKESSLSATGSETKAIITECENKKPELDGAAAEGEDKSKSLITELD